MREVEDGESHHSSASGASVSWTLAHTTGSGGLQQAANSVFAYFPVCGWSKINLGLNRANQLHKCLNTYHYTSCLGTAATDVFGHLSEGKEGRSWIHVSSKQVKNPYFCCNKTILWIENICLRAPPRGKEEVALAHSLPPHRSLRAARGRAEGHSPPPHNHTHRAQKMKTCLWDRFSPPLTGETESQILL